MLGAVVRDRVDPRVQRPDQVTEEMGLTILGAVPHLSRRNGDNAKGTAQVIEALRGVRLNTLHAHGTGPVLLTITSPGTGDGKSLVASNLALAFAEADYRTLLIDGDVRRGMLHRTLGAPRRPGLTDVLVDGVPLEQAVRPTRYESLAFIGCGARTRRAPELLGSAAMVRLLASLRATYQAIIIDSPPVGIVSDALTLTAVVDKTIIVAKDGASSVAELKRGTRLLQDRGATVAGPRARRRAQRRARGWGVPVLLVLPRGVRARRRAGDERAGRPAQPRMSGAGTASAIFVSMKVSHVRTHSRSS